MTSRQPPKPLYIDGDIVFISPQLIDIFIKIVDPSNTYLNFYRSSKDGGWEWNKSFYQRLRRFGIGDIDKVSKYIAEYLEPHNPEKMQSIVKNILYLVINLVYEKEVSPTNYSHSIKLTRKIKRVTPGSTSETTENYISIYYGQEPRSNLLDIWLRDIDEDYTYSDRLEHLDTLLKLFSRDVEPFNEVERIIDNYLDILATDISALAGGKGKLVITNFLHSHTIAYLEDSVDYEIYRETISYASEEQRIVYVKPYTKAFVIANHDKYASSMIKQALKQMVNRKALATPQSLEPTKSRLEHYILSYIIDTSKYCRPRTLAEKIWSIATTWGKISSQDKSLDLITENIETLDLHRIGGIQYTASHPQRYIKLKAIAGDPVFDESSHAEHVIRFGSQETHQKYIDALERRTGNPIAKTLCKVSRLETRYSGDNLPSHIKLEVKRIYGYPYNMLDIRRDSITYMQNHGVTSFTSDGYIDSIYNTITRNLEPDMGNTYIMLHLIDNILSSAHGDSKIKLYKNKSKSKLSIVVKPYKATHKTWIYTHEIDLGDGRPHKIEFILYGFRLSPWRTAGRFTREKAVHLHQTLYRIAHLNRYGSKQGMTQQKIRGMIMDTLKNYIDT